MPTYPYGTRVGPAVGGSLPGLPRKKEAGFTMPLIVVIDSGSGEFKIPSGYSKVRITAVGAGGTSVQNNWGGSGAGLAITDFMPASGSITYSVATVGDQNATTCSYQGVSLLANNGKTGTSTGAPGGTATGGLRNFTGGSGGVKVGNFIGGGGEAACTYRDGASANSNISQPVDGAGNRGYYSTTSDGFGADGGCGSNCLFKQYPLDYWMIFGTPGGIGAVNNTSGTGIAGAGGFPGGGAGAGAGSVSNNIPGAGCIRIELWP